VDLEDLAPALAIGGVDGDTAVEASRPQKGGVEDLGPVGGGEDDDRYGKVVPEDLAPAAARLE
jgi:hypothetical protein